MTQHWLLMAHKKWKFLEQNQKTFTTYHKIVHLEVGRSSCDKSVQRYVNLSALKGHKINEYILKPTCSKLVKKTMEFPNMGNGTNRLRARIMQYNTINKKGRLFKI